MAVVTDKTLGEILADYQEARQECKDWHNNMTRWRAWYDGNHYETASNRGKPKPKEERYQDPTPTNVVDLACGIILAQPLEFRASGWSPTFQEEEDSSHIEKYLLGTIEINNEREESLNQYAALFHFVRDGASVLYSAWDEELADVNRAMVDVPDVEMGVVPMVAYKETPIRLQVIDPKKTYWRMGGPKRWEAVYRVEADMSLHDVECNYNGGQRIDGFSQLSSIEQRKKFKGELIDVWRWRYKNVVKKDKFGEDIFNDVLGRPEVEPKWVVEHGLIYQNRWVWPMEDTDYPDLPYTIQFFKPVDRSDSKDWGHSIIRPLEETLIFFENSINRRQRQINIFSALPMMGKMQAGRRMHVDKALFNFIEMSPDEDITFPRWPGNPPDVDRQIEHFSGRLQQAGFTEAAYGRGEEATGYALSQMTDQNRIRLEQPVRHLELLWATWARKVLRLTETFAPNTVVRVYGQMQGKDFKEQVKMVGLSDYLVSAKLKPQFPGEKSRKHAMAVQVSGLLDQRTIIEEYLDKPQPDEIMERRLYDMAKQHPMMVQYGVMQFLAEMAEAGDEVATLVMQQQMQQGQPQQNEMAQEPTNVPGMPSATGELTQQEQGMEAPGQSAMERLKSILGGSPKMMGGE